MVNLVRAVVDTNVYVSAVIRPRGAMAEIVTRVRLRQYSILYSLEQLEEIRETVLDTRLSLKYGIVPSDIATIIELIVRRGEVIEIKGDLAICRDPDDDAIIEIAINGKADCIVSGDKDLLVLGSVEGVQVITPREFLERLRSQHGSLPAD